MWTAASYFDESDDNERAYAVGGFIGGQACCLHLDWAWREKILDAYKLRYFKASELNAGMGEFLQYRDDPSNPHQLFSQREKDIFTEIKTKSIDVFLDIRDLVVVGAVVLLPDYYRLLEEMKSIGRVLPQPYFFCAQLCIMESGFAMNTANEGKQKSESGCVRPIFDSQEEYSGRAKKMFDDFKEKNPLCSPWILPPHYEDDDDYIDLQVADNIVYEMRRLAIGTESEPPRPERIAMTRLKERTEHIYKLNYTVLKSIMEGQSITKTPRYNP
jgi:hypothetical protein